MTNMNTTTTTATEAFITFMANHPEVQAAASVLREDTFGIFMENNGRRFVREFARASR